MNSSDRRKRSCTNFGVIGKGNDQEFEFQEIEIIHKIDQDIESLIFHEIESFAYSRSKRP